MIKMNKWFLRLGVLLVITGLLFGCASNSENNQNESSDTDHTEEAKNNSSTDEVAKDAVRITISIDNETEYIDEKEIPIEDGDILMDVMEENFYIESDFDGGFITSINSVKPEEDEEKSWVFFVNDEMAQKKGAKELELTPGDKINWDLQAWD
jgi:UDP-3-O-acyl-N-acetylglucosamine deacetylase